MVNNTVSRSFNERGGNSREPKLLFGTLFNNAQIKEVRQELNIKQITEIMSLSSHFYEF